VKFGRIVSVDIGQPGESGVHIEGLRIDFEIEKTLTRTANLAEVEIYNLSEATRGKIEEVGNVMIINAGYEEAGGAEQLFRGDITRIEHEIDSPDIITKIEANDGDKILRETYISLSYSEGTSVQQVLNDITALIPDLTVQNNASSSGKEFTNGYSYVGAVDKALDDMAETLGLEWSFQDGELQVIDQDGTNDTPAVVIAVGMGLIGSPRKLFDMGGGVITSDDASGGAEIVSKAKSIEGWRVKSLLEPKLIPGGKMDLKSAQADGVFKILEVDLKGGTHSRHFTSISKVRSL